MHQILYKKEKAHSTVLRVGRKIACKLFTNIKKTKAGRPPPAFFTALSCVYLHILAASATFSSDFRGRSLTQGVLPTEMVIAKNVDDFETGSSEDLEVEDEEEIVTQVKGRHVESGHKTLLRSSPLYQYILETSVYPREAEVLKELRELTEQHSWNMMATPPDEGQFLMLLLRLMNAKKTLEVGVYTGYSLLCTALALPPDGKVIALDISREWYDIGAPVIQKAGVAHKIDFREGPAMDNIDILLRDETNHDSFDFIFVDADKDNYLNYHKRLMKLVRVGGLIGYDNTLWNGALVAGPDDPLPKYLRYFKSYILELNSFLAKDPRIQISQVPISDGVTLCRRLF